MNAVRCLLAATFFAIALAAQSQPPLLPSALPSELPAGLSADGLDELRLLEPVVWSDPWSAREALRALPPLDGEREAARQLLLAHSLLYFDLDDEYAAAVDAGLAALKANDEPLVTHNLAVVDGIRMARKGDFPQARRRLSEAVEGARASGLEATALLATAELAYVHAQAGDYETALLILQDAAQEALRTQDPFHQALTDEVYAVIYTYIDEFDRAVSYASRALDAYEELGYPLYAAEALYGLATAYRYGGQGELAIGAFRRYADLMASHNETVGRFSALYGLGMTYAELGSCESAMPLIDEALGADGPPDYDAELLKRAAVCRARAGDAPAALEDLDRARAILEGAPTMGATRWAIDLDRAASEVDAALGNYEQAYASLLRYHRAQVDLLRSNASEERQSRREVQENARQALQIELLEEQTRVRSLEVERQQREQRNERFGFLLLVLGLVLIASIVLWRLRDLRKYRELSNLDGLTAVANRRYIFEQLESLIGRLKSGRGSVSMQLIDVDDFKAINDRHGHPVGDRVLQESARVLAGVLRPGDEIARVGGEEFLLLLPRTDQDGAVQVADRAREALEGLRVMTQGDEAIRITASVGVATTTPSCDTADGLYAAADEALYRAKAGGKNRVELAAPI